MKSCFVVLVAVICVTVAEAQNCFKEGELKKQEDERRAKMFGPLIKKCKEEKKDVDDPDCKKYIKEKRKEAMKDCKSESVPNMKRECANKKLGIEHKKGNFSITDYKKKMCDLALPEKKAAVEKAFTDCEKEEDKKGKMCAWKKLADICPEMCKHGKGGKRGKGEKGGKGGKGKKDEDED